MLLNWIPAIALIVGVAAVIWALLFIYVISVPVVIFRGRSEDDPKLISANDRRWGARGVPRWVSGAADWLIWFFGKYFYRPAEGQLGVLYRWSRVWYLVDPDEWILVIPSVHRAKEVYLGPRRAKCIGVLNCYCRDRTLVDVELSVRYTVDLRAAENKRFVDAAAEFNDERWDSYIGSKLRPFVTEIVGRLPKEVLMTVEGRAYAQEILMKKLQSVLNGRGVRVKAVYVDSVLPAKCVVDAMNREVAAQSLGEAAKNAVEPVLALVDKYPQFAESAWFLEWAASLAQHGTPPQGLLLYHKESKQ